MTASDIPMNDIGRLVMRERLELDEAIRDVLDSGWLVHGRQHAAFEQEFAIYHDTRECIGVANGTDAIKIALAAVGVERGDSVATVANAGFYTTTACLELGATPYFVDVDPETLNVDPNALRAALGRNPRAVVITHLYGGLADVDGVIAEYRERGIPVIEDCAQATGACHVDGRKAGTLGDIGCFSFYPTKNLAAIGDGGAIITGDSELADRCRQIRQYGWSERYRVDRVGRNSRLDEIQAAVLRIRLRSLDARNDRRRAIAAAYAEAIAPEAGRLVFHDAPSHVAHLAVVRSTDRDGLRVHLSSAGIASDIHYPITDDAQPVWAATGRTPSGDDLVETHRAVREIVSVPCFPELHDDEVERVVDALRNFSPERDRA